MRGPSGVGASPGGVTVDEVRRVVRPSSQQKRVQTTLKLVRRLKAERAAAKARPVVVEKG
jgi:hypothetical protein